MSDLVFNGSHDYEYKQLEQVLFMWAQATLAEQQQINVAMAVNDDYFEKEVA
jgi:hypothetical protein